MSTLPLERLVKEAGDEMQKLRRAIRELAEGTLRLEYAGDPTTQTRGYYWRRWDWRETDKAVERGGPYSTPFEASLASVESAQR